MASYLYGNFEAAGSLSRYRVFAMGTQFLVWPHCLDCTQEDCQQHQSDDGEANICEVLFWEECGSILEQSSGIRESVTKFALTISYPASNLQQQTMNLASDPKTTTQYLIPF